MIKKILLIITLSLLTSSNLFASEWFNQMKFNKWLSENGHSQYLKNGGEPVDYCATLKKNSASWLYEECDNFPEGKMRQMNNLDIKIKNKALSATNIAYHSNPNRDTLIYYLWKYSYLSLIHI